MYLITEGQGLPVHDEFILKLHNLQILAMMDKHKLLFKRCDCEYMRRFEEPKMTKIFLCLSQTSLFGCY